MKQIKTGWLTITRKCNNFCEWCYTQNKLNCKSMSFDNAIQCVDKLSVMGVKRIILIGGEPTLYPKFIDLIKYISQKEIRVSLATNGRKLSDFCFARDVVNAGIGSINISLKGTSEEEYKKYTKSTGLNEAIIGYNNLQKLNFKNVSLSYVIVNNNKKKFNDIVHLIEKNNLKNIVFQFVKPVLSLKEQTDSFDIEAMGKFVTYIYNTMKKTTVNYCLEVSFPLCAIDDEILNKMVQENRIITCCHISKGTGLIFDTDLKILPCNHFAEFPYSEESIGLQSPEKISDFLDSEICVKLRKKAGSYPSKRCITCKKWEFCGGGCFTRWFYKNPADVIENLKGGDNNEAT